MNMNSKYMSVKEERENAPDVPNGERVVTGTVLKVETKSTHYGPRRVMTVKTDAGYAVWGTVPGNIDYVKHGDRVSFRAELLQSPSNSKFGFYKRPTQARVLDANEVRA